MVEHKEQPSYGQDGILSPWEPLSDEMKKGLELAAYICRMYGDGERWAEGILSHGEQVRARWWMEHEAKEARISAGLRAAAMDIAAQAIASDPASKQVYLDRLASYEPKPK